MEKQDGVEPNIEGIIGFSCEKMTASPRPNQIQRLFARFGLINSPFFITQDLRGI
jgi:hypothetical protein